jgi:hypothetical protein
MCYGPGRSNIIRRKWNIIHHLSWYWVGWMINDCSDRISVMVLLISARTWTCRKTVSLHIWKSCVLRIMPRSSWTNHRHITHLLFENTRVKFPEIAGRRWGPLHLTGHLETQTCDCVIIPSGASQGILLHSSHTKPLKNLTSRETLVTLQMLRKESYRLCHLFSVMRMMEQKQTHTTIKACVVLVCCKMYYKAQ